MTLVLSVMMLKIDSNSIFVLPSERPSVRPIRLRQMFLSTWLKVKGQVVSIGNARIVQMLVTLNCERSSATPVNTRR